MPKLVNLIVFLISYQTGNSTWTDKAQQCVIFKKCELFVLYILAFKSSLNQVILVHFTLQLSHKTLKVR